MRELLKIIVTDSAGAEHIFNEASGDVENYLDLRPCDDSGEPLTGFVQIITRTFTTGAKCDAETEALFFEPRRVDVLYGDA